MSRYALPSSGSNCSKREEKILKACSNEGVQYNHLYGLGLQCKPGQELVRLVVEYELDWHPVIVDRLEIVRVTS